MPYRPFGEAHRLWFCRAPEVVLSGPAGTGKSRACLEKLHYLAEKHPGMRGLILRKTRKSLTESALVTYETKVVPATHSCLSGPTRGHRDGYDYPNGSRLVVGGLDNPDRVMSTEYDVAFVQEARELAEDDWDAVSTRLRNGRMPYQQLMADTNPDAPTHWLKRRAEAGKLLMLESRHGDNPVLWDARRGDWTAAGREYVARLDALSGPRLHRLRHGRWVQAEGVVYEGWDAAVHLIDRFPVPPEWPRYWSVDFGFTNPFACGMWAEDPDGRLYLYRELYHTKRLVEDHARDILEAARWLVDGKVKRLPGRADPVPRAVVCDHDAEDRATLKRHLGLPTVPAPKDVAAGIQAVAARLKVQPDGKPRLYVLRDALVTRDRELAESGKPCCTAEEVDGYVWDTGGGQKKGDVPLKENDHGLDAARYLVYWKDRSPGGAGRPLLIGRKR